MAFLLEGLTKPGQIVLDCFCGLGSTLVAAQQLGRRWIGCDRSQAYCQWAIRWLRELKKQEPYNTSTVSPGVTPATNGEPFGDSRLPLAAPRRRRPLNAPSSGVQSR
jgi:hypothetical protein